VTLVRRLAVNLALLAGSVAVFLVALELFFRFVLPASDYPRLTYAGDVLRYRPGQQGHYRVQDEIDVPFAINAQGWNAARPSYAEAKPAGATRVAIVGDSFVEAFQVPATASLAEQLEALPGRTRVEALRFGMSGAPFSHYLWMLEREALRFRPDVVVLSLVHNDFDESWRDAGGRYGVAFQHLAVEDDRITGWIAPRAYDAGASDLLMRSAALRFLRFNRQVSRSALTTAIFGEPAPPPPRKERQQPATPGVGAASTALREAAKVPGLPWVDANVFLERVLDDPDLLAAATDAMVARAAALAKQHGFRLLLTMDGARQAIYEGRDSRALALNRLVAEMATRHGVDFLDLHPRFAEAWAHERRRFDHVHDNHWNANGHAVVARAIRAWLDR